MLELKGGDHPRVQTVMLEFIALPSPFSNERNIWPFYVAVVQGWKRNVHKKRDARAKLLFY